ncbi:MAG: YbjN domain-containing protein [Muribaculaceae bacterium]|nr:YbjN domain-containing protein [Muribaculaceae bacterium]MDE6540670.1 YbjN domain-containing protein [Muribaculaceae bacterium]
MNSIDKNIIRGILDEMHISSTIDDDGDIMVIQSADEDFVYDVFIYILVNNNRLSFLAAAQGYEPQADLLFLANRHNCRRNLPTAVVRDGAIRMEYSYMLDEEVSRDYIRENCIGMTLSAIWHGFMELERESD